MLSWIPRAKSLHLPTRSEWNEYLKARARAEGSSSNQKDADYATGEGADYAPAVSDLSATWVNTRLVDLEHPIGSWPWRCC